MLRDWTASALSHLDLCLLAGPAYLRTFLPLRGVDSVRFVSDSEVLGTNVWAAFPAAAAAADGGGGFLFFSLAGP